ncbi:hypothetical protein GOV09_01975 [Candidatus Woesearchaeota archaeon]|nr:hypothetical protein [Candidatus Woesearchaeota archaeon]
MDKDQMMKMAKTILRRYHKDTKYLDKLYKTWQKELKTFYALVDEVNTKNFKKLTNRELTLYYKAFLKAHINVWNHFIFIDAFDPYGDQFVQDHLKKNKLDIAKEDLSALLQSPLPSYITEENIAFLQIVQKALKKDRKLNDYLVEHQKKFYWFRNNYGHVKYMTVEDFYKRLHMFVQKHSAQEIKEELKQIQKISDRDKVMQKCKLSKADRVFFDLFSKLTSYRDERKKMNLLGLTAARYVLYKISKRLEIDVGTLEYLAPWEVKDIFHWDRKKLFTLRGRKENCIWIAPERDFHYFGMDDAKEMFDLINKSIMSKHEELKGVTASVGKAKGRVKIIHLVKDFPRFEKGDILVTQMTRPEFTPILKKAAAIVTDEGGITSHAAIVSRELGIPCVIGTQIATKKLKEGDLIEVDADHGRVKILR